MDKFSTGFSNRMADVEKSLSDLNKEISRTSALLEHIGGHSVEIVKKLSGLTSPSAYLKGIVEVHSFLLKYLGFLIEVNCKFELMQISDNSTVEFSDGKSQITEKVPQVWDKSGSDINLNKLSKEPNKELPITDKVSTETKTNSNASVLPCGESEVPVKKKKKKSKNKNKQTQETSKAVNQKNDQCVVDEKNLDLKKKPEEIDQSSKTSASNKESQSSEINSKPKITPEKPNKIATEASLSTVKESQANGDLSSTSVEISVKNNQQPVKEIPVAEVTPRKSSENNSKSEDVPWQAKENKNQNKGGSDEIELMKIPREVGRRYEVSIAHIKSPSELYVNFIDTQQDLFKELLEKLQAISLSPGRVWKVKKEIRKTCLSKEIGNYALYYSKCEEMWCRARVTDWCHKYKDDLVNIFLYDFGESKCVSIEDLQALPEDLKKYPAFAQRCHLHGIFPPDMKENSKLLNWGKESSEKILFLTENSNKIEVEIAPNDSYHPPESLPVTMWLVDKGQKCVNQLLVKTKYAVKKGECNSDQVEKSNLVENASLEKWNPMKQDFESYQNLYELNMNDPSAVIYNYVGKDYERICVHFAKTGKCFKGQACKKEHTHLDPLGFTTDQEEVYKTAFNVLSTPHPGSILSVQVTCILSLNRFCCITEDPVWSADEENLQSLLRFMNSKENIRDMKKLLIPPSTGQMVIAQYSQDDSWYRAKILDSEPENDVYHLVFVDYGNKERLPLSRIRAIEARYLHLPFQAIQCQIFGVDSNPKASEKEGISYLNTKLSQVHVSIEVVSVFPGDNVSLLVHLIDRSGKNIGADLIAKGYGIYKQEIIVSNELETVPG